MDVFDLSARCLLDARRGLDFESAPGQQEPTCAAGTAAAVPLKPTIKLGLFLLDPSCLPGPCRRPQATTQPRAVTPMALVTAPSRGTPTAFSVVRLSRRHAQAPQRLLGAFAGLYSGARPGELCQLHVGDVRREGEIWVIDINAHGDKRLKTESSAGLVPIHPQLIGLGWLDYVEHCRTRGQERLFRTSNGPSRCVSDRAVRGNLE